MRARSPPLKRPGGGETAAVFGGFGGGNTGVGWSGFLGDGIGAVNCEV